MAQATLPGRRVLVHPSGAPFVRTTPLPQDFRPRHCAGDLEQPSGCLHLHPGDEVSPGLVAAGVSA